MTEKQIRDEAMRKVMWEVGHTNNDVTRYISDAVANQVVRDESDGWIPVSERLPEEHGTISNKVLVTQGVVDKQISFGWLRGGTWVTSAMLPFAKQELITHWMPLPGIPQNW